MALVRSLIFILRAKSQRLKMYLTCVGKVLKGEKERRRNILDKLLSERRYIYYVSSYTFVVRSEREGE